MWHVVAESLADRHTVIAADLPGYGDSFRPLPAPALSSFQVEP
jgi:haloacetate dehalogenase